MNRSNRTLDASSLAGLELTERSFRAPKSQANSHLEERLAQANESRKEKLELIRRYVAEMKEDLHGSVNLVKSRLRNSARIFSRMFVFKMFSARKKSFLTFLSKSLNRERRRSDSRMRLRKPRRLLKAKCKSNVENTRKNRVCFYGDDSDLSAKLNLLRNALHEDYLELKELEEGESKCRKLAADLDRLLWEEQIDQQKIALYEKVLDGNKLT